MSNYRRIIVDCCRLRIVDKGDENGRSGQYAAKYVKKRLITRQYLTAGVKKVSVDFVQGCTLSACPGLYVISRALSAPAPGINVANKFPNNYYVYRKRKIKQFSNNP